MSHPNNSKHALFIASDEMAQSQANMRDAAKALAHNKQEMMANELSRLASDEYLDDILEHTRQMEIETLPDANLIDLQREIQWYMRPFLIDFLIEAHSAFGLLRETLFLTVNLLDRYCARRVVYKQHYQLVGCAALLIAAKYGDKKDRVPQISELNNMCCGLYDPGMFTQMEMHVLNTLEWVIGHPTVDFFSRLIAVHEHDDVEVEHMAAYFCEIALYHRDCVSAKPSIMARASLAIARGVLGRPEVQDDLFDADCHATLLALSQHALHPSATLSRKYTTSSRSRVSTKLSDWLAARAALVRHESMCPPLGVDPCNNALYRTPQRGIGATAGIDGYMTPPITPETHGFNGPDAPHGYPVPAAPHASTSESSAHPPLASSSQSAMSVARGYTYYDNARSQTGY